VPYGISVPPSWSIVECELFAILGGLRSIPNTYAGTVCIYSDCVPALWMIDAMKPLGDSVGLWDIFTPILNRFESVSMSWVPGHHGIHGKELVDTAPRNAVTPLKAWRWDGLCFGIGQLEMARTARSDEWLKWHREEGHSYYTRKPRKPSHLKKLTRMDFYVIMRLHSGMGVSGHDTCGDDLPRYHLLDCLRFAAGLPCRSTRVDDKVIGDWVDWARHHFYLGMGIPKGLEEIDGCLVVAGNPFTGCAIVNRDGSMVQVGFPMRPCGRCGSLVANHKCRRPTDTIPDKYYFLGPNDTHCRMCDSGATLVNQHLRLKPRCHDAWRDAFWDDMRTEWDDVPERLKTALVVPFGIVITVVVNTCRIYDRAFSGRDGLRAHWRGVAGDDCFLTLIGNLEDKLFAGGDMF